MKNYNANEELDQAYKIIMEANTKALNLCKKNGMSVVNTYHSLMQSAFRNYADILQDDGEAIHQIREFLNEWETELTKEHH